MYCRVLSLSFFIFAVLVVWHPYSRPYSCEPLVFAFYNLLMALQSLNGWPSSEWLLYPVLFEITTSSPEVPGIMHTCTILHRFGPSSTRKAADFLGGTVCLISPVSISRFTGCAVAQSSTVITATSVSYGEKKLRPSYSAEQWTVV